MRRVSPRPDDGFTLAEMLVVLVVISLATSAIVFGLASKPVPLRAVALQLVAQLNAARIRAIASDQPTTVAVNRNATGYRITGSGSEIRLPGRARISYSPLLGGSRPIPRSVMAYYGDGSASGGQFMLADGTTQITVRVDWLSGAASIATGRP